VEPEGRKEAGVGTLRIIWLSRLEEGRGKGSKVMFVFDVVDVTLYKGKNWDDGVRGGLLSAAGRGYSYLSNYTGERKNICNIIHQQREYGVVNLQPINFH